MTTRTEDSEGKASRGSIIERHVQSVLLTVITAALLFSGSFVLQAREESARTATQLAVLSTEVAGLRLQLTTLQANYVTREEFRDHEARLRALERSVPVRREEAAR